MIIVHLFYPVKCQAIEVAAAVAAGVDVSEHMPTLETMQGPDFNAEAHNKAMQEISNK